MVERMICCTLGLFLLVTAGLKLYGLSVAPFAQYGRLLNPTVQFLAVEWEIILGIWLLTARKSFAAWVAALLTFLLFAGVSLHLAVIGQASCGCFGSIKASPWHAFAVDGTAIFLLGVARPDFRVLRGLSRAQWWILVLRGAGLAVLLIALGAGTIGLASVVFGSPDAALARLRGERISIQPRLTDVGEGQAGETLETIVEVVNRTDQPLTILGGSSDCSCVTTKDLPVTLTPGEVHPVSVQVRLPGNSGFFNRKAYFWTDCPGARRVVFGLTAKINPTAQALAGMAED